MANRVERRSNYWFDPTASEAIARADRDPQKKGPHDSYHASPPDVARYSQVIFKPDKPISDHELRRLRWKLKQLL